MTIGGFNRAAKPETIVPMLSGNLMHASFDFAETQAYLAAKGLGSRLAGAHPSRSGKRFRSTINAVHGAGLYIAYMQYGADVEIDAPPERSDYGFSIPYGGIMASTAAGEMRACTRNRTVLASPGAPQRLFLAGETQRLALSIQQDLVRRRLNALSGEEIGGVVEFEPTLDVTSGPGRLITSNMELIVAEQDRGTEVFADRLREAHFVESVLTTLLLYHPHSHRALLERPVSAPASRDVKRALDYMHANLEEALTLEDLVDIAQVPGRTLNEHFRAFTGRAPMAYLREMRLHAARRLLMSGEARSVTCVATRFGFLHLGRFSMTYLRTFGESPSETLVRACRKDRSFHRRNRNPF